MALCWAETRGLWGGDALPDGSQACRVAVGRDAGLRRGAGRCVWLLLGPELGVGPSIREAIGPVLVPGPRLWGCCSPPGCAAETGPSLFHS